MLDKRYSYFDALQKELNKNYHCKDLPPKKLGKLSNEALLKRKKDLTDYIRTLFQSTQLINTIALRNFFELDIHSQSMKTTELSKIANVDLHYNVVDMCAINSQVAICSLSKGEHTGFIQIFQISGQKMNIICEREYAFLISKIYFEVSIEYLYACTETGEILIYRISSKNNYAVIDDIKNIKVHSDNITGLVVVNKNIYTIGVDGRIVVTIMNDWQMKDILNSKSQLTCICYDINDRIILAANIISQIFIIDTINAQIEILSVLNTKSGKPIHRITKYASNLFVGILVNSLQ